MSDIEALVGKHISVMTSGPKGVISFKGILQGIDKDFIIIEEEKGGMLGGKGKKKITLFSKYGIIGIRSEDS